MRRERCWGGSGGGQGRARRELPVTAVSPVCPQCQPGEVVVPRDAADVPRGHERAVPANHHTHHPAHRWGLARARPWAPLVPVPPPVPVPPSVPGSLPSPVTGSPPFLGSFPSLEPTPIPGSPFIPGILPVLGTITVPMVPHCWDHPMPERSPPIPGIIPHSGICFVPGTFPVPGTPPLSLGSPLFLEPPPSLGSPIPGTLLVPGNLLSLELHCL